MASFTFTIGKTYMLTGQVDLSSDTIRMLIVMTNSSVTNAGQQDVATISAISVLDEMDGSGYTRKTLSTLDVDQDNTNHRAVFSSDPLTWTALSARL